MGKAKGENFKKKGVAGKIKSPEMNSRTKINDQESTGDFEEAVSVGGQGGETEVPGCRSEQAKRHSGDRD